MGLRLFIRPGGLERSSRMPRHKSYEDPNRDRGAKESPGQSGKESPGSSRDRDFRGEKKHEDPMRKPDEGSPREPRF
jgi:hypothetical protein